MKLMFKVHVFDGYIIENWWPWRGWIKKTIISIIQVKWWYQLELSQTPLPLGEGLSSWCSTKEWIFTSWLLILNLSSAIFLHLHLSVGSSTESHHELRMVGVYWSGGIINIRSTEIDFTKLQLSGVHHFLRPFSQL